MTTIEALMLSNRQFTGPDAKYDPLRDTDILQEAQLLDLRVSALTQTAGILIELRTALQLREGNAALLVVRGVRSVETAMTSPWQSPLFARSLVGSTTTMHGNLFTVELAAYPDTSLKISGESAEYYQLEVPGLDEAPPDYSDVGWDQVAAELPSWSSEASIVRMSRRDR